MEMPCIFEYVAGSCMISAHDELCATVEAFMQYYWKWLLQIQAMITHHGKAAWCFHAERQIPTQSQTAVSKH